MGDLLEPQAEPTIDLLGPEEYAEERRIEAEAAREQARFEIECQIDALREEQEAYKDLSRIDAYASKTLVFAGGGIAIVGGPVGIAVGLILGGGGYGFDMASTNRANTAADLGEQIARLEKKMEKM